MLPSLLWIFFRNHWCCRHENRIQISKCLQGFFLGKETFSILYDKRIQKSNISIQEIQWDLIIKDKFTEPHHPQQNPAEGSAIKFLKSKANTLMNRTNTHTKVLLLCYQYIAHLNNICTIPKNNWTIPNKVSRGYTRYFTYLPFHMDATCLILRSNGKMSRKQRKTWLVCGVWWMLRRCPHIQDSNRGHETSVNKECCLPYRQYKTQKYTSHNQERCQRQAGEARHCRRKSVTPHLQAPNDQDINANDVEDLPEPIEWTIIEKAEEDDE